MLENIKTHLQNACKMFVSWFQYVPRWSQDGPKQESKSSKLEDEEQEVRRNARSD